MNSISLLTPAAGRPPSSLCFLIDHRLQNFLVVVVVIVIVSMWRSFRFVFSRNATVLCAHCSKRKTVLAASKKQFRGGASAKRTFNSDCDGNCAPADTDRRIRMEQQRMAGTTPTTRNWQKLVTTPICKRTVWLERRGLHMILVVLFLTTDRTKIR